MITEPNVHLIVLAAGASTRMGRSKALLPFGDLTALERVVRCGAQAGAGSSIVVGGHDAEAIRAVAGLAGARFVVNPRWERGQTSSLLAGFAELPPDAAGFLLFPVDCPLVRPETVARILAAPSAAAIAVPRYGGRRGHPALFRRATFAEFHALGDDEPAHAVLRRDPARVTDVEVDDPGVALPLDTPADYERALETFRAAAGGASEEGDVPRHP